MSIRDALKVEEDAGRFNCAARITQTLRAPKMTRTANSLRIGRRYRSNRLAAHYDALVIGSGMGGLTTAALLSDLGQRVCVVEQHYTAGGYTHSYERKGYEWDVGVHYIGDVGKRTRTRRLFDHLSGGGLKWAPMAPEYDRFFVGGNTFCAVAGKAEFRDNLIRQFPAQQDAIDRYLALLKQASGATYQATMARVLKPWQRQLAGPYIKWRTPDLLYRNTYEVLRELTDDQDLIATLCGQWGDMGLPPKRSAFMVHAMIARHYMHGGFYPVGGSWQIAKTIIPEEFRQRAARCLRTRAQNTSTSKAAASWALRCKTAIRSEHRRWSQPPESSTRSNICWPPTWSRRADTPTSSRTSNQVSLI